MSLFRKLPLFWKFTIFGCLVTLMLMTVLAISYRGLTGSDSKFNDYSVRYQGIAHRLSQIYAQGLQTEQAIRNIVLNPSDQKALSNHGKANSDLLALLDETSGLAKEIPELSSALANFTSLWKQHSQVQQETITRARGASGDAVSFLNSNETPSWRGVKDAIQALQKISDDKLKKQRASLNDFTKTNFKYTVSALLIALLVINLLMFLFWRIVYGAMKDMNIRLHDIASGEGDLTKRLAVSGNDEFTEAARLLNEFIGKLDTILIRVNTSAAVLASSTGGLMNTAERMAASAEGVTSQTVTVATASEEMAATSSDIAQNCHRAAESARRVAVSTQDGVSVVKQTVEGIRGRGDSTRQAAASISSLGDRSDQIGAIVATIEDIADQTNLLALNAAIEAARAGEMGRGFAVVADEVRALAERTTRATKEIGDMIRTIQDETRKAVTMMEAQVRDTERGASEAGCLESTLMAVLEQVQEVTLQISQIATAAEEQTATTTEITGNIQRIADEVDASSRDAHGVSEAAQSLAGAGAELQNLMKQFRLSQ